MDKKNVEREKGIKIKKERKKKERKKKSANKQAN